MRSETMRIIVEVPVEALDFSDCGDGQGEIYGLGCARVKVGTRYGTELLPVLNFGNGPRAAQLMHKELGESTEAVELPEEKSPATAMPESRSHRQRMGRFVPDPAIVEEERQRLLDDPISKRRKLA